MNGGKRLGCKRSLARSYVPTVIHTKGTNVTQRPRLSFRLRLYSIDRHGPVPAGCHASCHLLMYFLPSPLRSLRIDTLCVSIDLQPLLRHLGILQEVQRHPDQVPLDLVELLPDLVRGHERIVEMPLLEFVVFGQEGLVVGEGFD